MLRLEDILPADNVTRYDKNRPPTFRQHPAIVFLHITVLMLDSFDQNEMTFTTGGNEFEEDFYIEFYSEKNRSKFYCQHKAF